LREAPAPAKGPAVDVATAQPGAGEADGASADTRAAGAVVAIGKADRQDAPVFRAAAKTEPAQKADGAKPARSVQKARQAHAAEVAERVLAGDPDALRFTFRAPTAAAVFVRGDALWMVFDGAEPPDLGQIADSASGVFGVPRLLRSDTVQVIRVPLRASTGFVAAATANSWSIGVAPGELASADSVALVPRSRDGQFTVAAMADGAHAVHWLDDPVVGDQIGVVTVEPGAAVAARAQTFVEFA